MKRELRPSHNVEGSLSVPGDKSIAHRAALLSILASEKVTIRNFPDNDDCRSSLEAAQALGLEVRESRELLDLFPPEQISAPESGIIDCGNSGTTTRLLSGILAGSNIETTLTGDESLSGRPMKRIIDPISEMGGELFSEDGTLPLRIVGRKLTPIEYTPPVASAQVKSAVLLAGLSSGCSVTVREKTVTRDHTERMLEALGEKIEIRDIKPTLMPDPNDPRKRRMVMPEDFKREVKVSTETRFHGGEVDIPGDISTAAFFWAAAAIGRKSVTIENVGLNPTRTAFLDHLKAVGCKVEIADKETISGEPRGTVTVTGGELKHRRISGDVTVGLIDEIPIVGVIAAFANGTTVIRDAQELRVKESDRLEAVSHNLNLMGVKCGVLEDGLAIEGGRELSGADFLSYGDHRIAMAFSIASLFVTGPSSIDDESCVAVSCRSFYELLDSLIS